MGVVITSEAGSLGSALANYLAEPGHHVQYWMTRAQALGHSSTLKLAWSDHLLGGAA